MKPFILLAVVLLTGCSQKEKKHEELDSLFSSYWEERSKFFPIEATQQGDNRYNHLLPNDQTKEFRDALKSFYQNHLARLNRIKRDSLDENDKISFDVFKYEMSMQVEGLENDMWMIPFQQFWGLPLLMGQLGSGEQAQPFKTVTDYYNWISRLEGFSAWSNSAIENFRHGIKAGFVLPRSLVVKMIPQMKDLIVKDPKNSLFYSPINKFPKHFSQAQRQELTEAYVKVISTHVVPSFKKMHRFLKSEYLPHARESHGISSLKGGKRIYDYMARYWTTTDKTPEAIYQTGLAEVSRIRAEMEKVKTAAGFKGNLKQFFEYMRKDPKFRPYKSSQEVIAAFNEIHQRMSPKVAGMFGRTPKTSFEIRQTEEFRAASASAEYSPGTPDGSRPGIFYIPIVDATQFNSTSGMESLFLHEAIPGHHYQVSLQQENQDLPQFRRFAWYGAYGEGWALYSESLGKELGLYQDPYQYMGALGDEMHRALRLVIDVAIHKKGMSRERAVQYMMENEPISKDGAVAEVERYMAIPGQALSYKMGALKIADLRNKYAGALGGRFKLADFHDEILKDGCLPLAVIEKKMDDWAHAKGSSVR